ncbi:hypothetical protein [Halomarina litorea]|uniref:hypothetical protein n=1 Tax=Halomarina litorea TaxID=2961595 RepID=UPI0020C4485E|nr:hypothetical protein [Halomarina sp. BCD28]
MTTPARRGRRALLVALALTLTVVLAGCSAPLGSDPGGDPPTVTPASVPSDVPGGPSRAMELVPGLTSEGVASPVRLAEAHRERLAGTTFTRRVTETITGPSGPLRTTNVTVRANLADFAFRYVRTQRAAPGYPVRASTPLLDVWSNGSHTLSRVGIGDDARYRSERGLAYGEAVTGITGNEAVISTLSAFEVRVEAVDGGYRLTASGATRPDGLRPPTLTRNLTNATLSAFVTGEGLVRSYRVEYDVALDGRRLHVVETSRITGVGSTCVDRPEWATEAARNGSGGRDVPGRGDPLGVRVGDP